MTQIYIPFRSKLKGLFAKRFYDQIEILSETEKEYVEIENHILGEVEWATKIIKINPEQRRIYRAVWLLFRDLLRVGWTYRWKSGVLEMTPPLIEKPIGNRAIRQTKSVIRQAMYVPRRERIVDARSFVERMERPVSNGLVMVPITS